MVRAWYLRDDDWGDRKKTGMTDPPRFVGINQVYRDTGVQYRKVEGDDFENNTALKEFEKEFDITAQDTIEVTASFPQEKSDRFYEEHLHSIYEIRLVLDGCGYFDLRDLTDRWIRVEMKRGDLIVLPPGVYHRFTVNTEQYIKAKRYFMGHDEWIAFCRADVNTDKLPERRAYLEHMAKICQT